MSNLAKTAWGPGLIGLGISDLMFGVSLAQFTYYAWFFPDDHRILRLLVLLVFITDVLHLIGTSEFYWTLLLQCHRSNVPTCNTNLSWGAYIAVPANYIITFAVQCFYCHRVWIITGNKRRLTLIAFLIAVVQLALGIWASIAAVKNGTIRFLFTTPIIPAAAGVSTVCDIIITSTIFKYLWRSQIRGRSNMIHHLVVVFINMGALTCVISIAVGVVYLKQGDHYWVEAPAVIISRCYVNSLLAALNARQRIRERELTYTIELPTIPTIH